MPTQNYIELKRKALEKYFGFLNPQQQKAVFNINGPQLVLAGAGSGKTSVIINRILNLVMFGDAYNDEIVQGSTNDIECIQKFLDGSCDDVELLRQATAVAPIKPWNIVAITFTNKSAKELKDRLFSALGEQAYMVNASTFHALCLKILRLHIHLLGYDNNFTIYDTKDSQNVIKSCIEELDISEKNFPPKTIASIISSYKGELVAPEDIKPSQDFKLNTTTKIYKLYQQKLKDSNALDFDDIIKLTVDLFNKHIDILTKYQDKFKYIMVDEYQDTNYAQFQLIRLLSQTQLQNICVVGDDDQSIYGFRGADIENILSFEKYFPNAVVIKLEQNYRSTQKILDASNQLISHNSNRKDKKLWTSVSGGDNVSIYQASDETDEANFISETIQQLVQNGNCSYKDCAVLYRVNALSNALEKSMIKNSIPYRVYGGTRFYERKEIKDIIAYLNVINNENDLLRLKRIINMPKRGIGDTTIEVLEEMSRDLRVSPLQIMRNADEYPLLAKKATTLKNVAKMFDSLIAKAQNPNLKLNKFIDTIIEDTDYDDYLKTLGDEGVDRMGNILELKSNAIQYMLETENPTLGGFLEQISLFNDIDTLNDDDCISLMTIHSAKGLEFENVFIIGMEESIFPSNKSFADDEEIEEERRVAYVGITRAKKHLLMSLTTQRTLYGLTKSNYQSRFISEMGSNLNYKKSSKSSKNSVKAPKAFQSFTLQQQIAKNKAQERVASTPQNVLFDEGDRVLHSIFGIGTVLKVTNTGGDCMLKVDFAKVGLKTIMTNYTKVKKID